MLRWLVLGRPTPGPARPNYFYIAASELLCHLYENEARFISNSYAITGRFGLAKNKNKARLL
jgi:hypothetical protein